MRLLILISLLSASACTGGGSLDDGEPQGTPPEQVAFVTSDGLEIAGPWQVAPGADSGPGALLLHQVSEEGGEVHDRSDWDGLREDLVAAGVSTLAIDFRSHGASDATDVPLFDLPSRRDQLPLDVRAALSWLTEGTRPAWIDGERLAVVGLGLGASLAVVAVHESMDDLPPDWGARSAVAISARSDRAADLNDDGTAVHDMELANSLYIAGAEHPEDAADAQELYDETRELAQLELVAGTAAHGFDLLATEPAVGDLVVQWITETWN